jgi:2-amino-4-hydroxy-6-hydroxymethyldihydropteridine diphosphokinase
LGVSPTHEIYLALGSNLGDRLGNLHIAVRLMPPKVYITSASQVYETPPWGYQEQPPFLNQVVRGKTRLKPEALLKYLKQLEIQMGRQPSVRYGPRLIDIDILFYDDLIQEKGDLTIPHPRLHERAFVLVPLADLAPEYRHPIRGETVHQLLAQVDTHQIRLYQPEGTIVDHTG